MTIPKLTLPLCHTREFQRERRKSSLRRTIGIDWKRALNTLCMMLFGTAASCSSSLTKNFVAFGTFSFSLPLFIPTILSPWFGPFSGNRSSSALKPQSQSLKRPKMAIMMLPFQCILFAVGIKNANFEFVNSSRLQCYESFEGLLEGRNGSLRQEMKNMHAPLSYSRRDKCPRLCQKGAKQFGKVSL